MLGRRRMNLSKIGRLSIICIINRQNLKIFSKTKMIKLKI